MQRAQLTLYPFLTSWKIWKLFLLKWLKYTASLLFVSRIERMSGWVGYRNAGHPSSQPVICHWAGLNESDANSGNI